MGQHKVKKRCLLGVTFQPASGSFSTSFSLQDLDDLPDNAHTIAKKASEAYSRRINNIRNYLKESEKIRRKRKPVPAILMWNFGDQIFRLISDLERLNTEIEGLYYHLSRDTGVSRSTLKRVVAFRRYYPDKKTLPPNLTWGQLKGAPKKYAQDKQERRNN